MSHSTDDVRIDQIKELLPPVALMERFPVSEVAAATVLSSRQATHNILAGDDDRLLVISGPCSIHDVNAAKEYASRLKVLRETYAGTLEIVMRVYFEKPRTTVGWKGLINDPYMDDSFKINDGLRIARQLLCEINDMGLPTAGEFLDVISPQYVGDLMSWGAIGARTTESQIHRELASGLSCPVGFKNGTKGSIQIAIDGIGAGNNPHHFLSVTKFGHSAIITTKGNEDCHIILRGGSEPNYSAEHVNATAKQLAAAGVNEKVMVDFSHANSAKQFKRQLDVSTDIAQQISAGSHSLFGVMIESHLVEGNQKVVEGQELTYGQSITDACIGWHDTEAVMEQLSQAVLTRRS
ncbi:MAG: 3-deoxy-7-phosphoheptulonate synthase AroG [Pseudomonadales bacterium]|nr:3-deoxy-7-phosphoheptulonate synthase AroG [Pseudomonadales bacterium]MDG2079126.1 3-deoxy-7-phosphoheptulonate synthase AroG [Pseudomonadales bacterium]